MSTQFSLASRGSATELALAKKLPDDTTALAVALFAGEDGLEFAATGLFDDDLEVAIWELFSAVGATGKAGEIHRVPSIEGIEVDFIVGVGLGNNDKLDDEALRRAAGVAARSLAGVDSVATTLGAFGLRAAVEGFALGAYDYKGIRSESAEAIAAKKPVGTVTFLSLGDKKTAKAEFQAAQITAESVMLARDLVNAPSSHLYPESYAEIIKKEAEDHGIDVEILDEKKLEKLGFGGILAVGNGSARKPRLVRLTWAPKKAKKSVALVGKGITFDTGGISLKPGSGMDDMISDMGGSAAVVATVIGAARLDLKVKITATIPLAENMPSGDAYRPGDVITHYGGITSEILNTDAEGRLVLSDAIARACEDKPDYLIETATLTGAQLVALGDRTSGVMGSDAFRDRIAEIGRSVGEQAWAMPLPEELSEAIKSPVADIRNITKSRSGGMLAAGWYLSHFVAEGIDWVHVDIAGPSYNNAGVYGYTPKRATGVPVRTFLAALAEISEEK
ncbi:leucyl aminopeptidase [Corynebacterium pseudotuberculosis 258]|uniref:Probable cytosol aminopeptidase n=1 Tax=Corynebacterium pseudotuberculosis 258 TaxID=1168865 RepID=A0AAU8Q6F9_CORPS|nr:leucyl aminopeptidase [Corynebacterium pseudotuberculosis]AEQ06988.1 leucyl aminopeptidase [Corynebacterium pseudotuberculosis CIP 52.97]AFK17085.1 leucyl aminopeptidase [Corynebacterium pseudotuberculosis 258]